MTPLLHAGLRASLFSQGRPQLGGSVPDEWSPTVYIDAPLPGLEPDFFRVEVTRVEQGYYDMRVTAAQDRRYISAADTTFYCSLTAGEMWDVLSATLDALGGV